jgi:predicted amidohydrolase
MANRGFLFGPDGKVLNRYDKIHMFDVDLDNGESWRESAAYRPGSEARVVSLPFAEMGFTICYDVRFPALFRAQAVAGAEVMTVPAAFTRQTGEAHWEILLRARAIENGVFVIAAAQAGVHEDGRETFGHSMIIDPWGRVLASAGGTGEAVIVADIDPAAVKAAHDKIPNLKNGREFSIEKVPAALSGSVIA